jgi:DNA repair exonuclease SbcCD ATPase subunit
MQFFLSENLIMIKIASPQELTQELKSILSYAVSHEPKRSLVAHRLRDLADRVAFGSQVAVYSPEQEKLFTFLHEKSKEMTGMKMEFDGLEEISDWAIKTHKEVYALKNEKPKIDWAKGKSSLASLKDILPFHETWLKWLTTLAKKIKSLDPVAYQTLTPQERLEDLKRKLSELKDRLKIVEKTAVDTFQFSSEDLTQPKNKPETRTRHDARDALENLNDAIGGVYNLLEKLPFEPYKFRDKLYSYRFQSR